MIARVRHPLARAAAWLLAGAVIACSMLPRGAARAQHADAGAAGHGAAEGDGEPEPDVGDAGASDAFSYPPAVTVQYLVPDASAPVARGNGVLVTASDLAARVNDAPDPVQRAWAQDPRLLDEVVDRLVADRLLANEARRRGLENDPYVRAAVERALVARLRATAINPAAGDGARVTDEDIRRFYDSHPERFHIPERRRAWVIFATDRREAERILREARAVRPEPRRRRRGRHAEPPRAAVNFRELARRYNTDPDLVRLDSELHEITATQTDIDVRLRDAVFSLPEPGEVYPDVVRAYWRGTPGWFVVRYVSRRPPIDRSLPESADWIRQRLVLERRVAEERRLVQQLTRAAAVQRVPAADVVRLTVVDAGARD